MWINCRTGYTFKKVYGHLNKVVAKCKQGCIAADIEPFCGIADEGNTFGHIPFHKECKKQGVKPIYGVQLPVTEDLQREVRRYPYNWMTFIARNTDGLKEIYNLVDLSFQQFYYRQRITYSQVNQTSPTDIVVLSGMAPRYDLLKRQVCPELSPCTPFCMRKVKNGVACVDNFYVDPGDEMIYEPFADDRLRERKTSPIYIINYSEWLSIYKGDMAPLNLMTQIANSCNVELPIAPMVQYNGKEDMKTWCEKGAKKRGIDLQDPIYKERYQREMALIQEKEYTDYFLVVADVIKYAKTKMAVGPSRGSSAGSLVCYLMGITEIDPLKYDLYFERFIDINRFDLPDIDIDFQDDKRHLVIKYLEKKYGADHVAQIGNINRMKPKSAITRFAQALGVPIDDVQELKDAMLERSGGDARANDCMADTLDGTDIGKKFIDLHPCMDVVRYIEAHPSHTGVHAAGVLVCNEPITNYCGINSRDKKRVGMLDKKDCEVVNLLKIDALGLRTLSIIADVCDQIGKPYDWMYEIPVDDSLAYKVFNDHRFNGIFQFEGPAIQNLAKHMPIENLEDVAALTALGRPGPLMGGGASSFIAARSGKQAVEYLSDHSSVIDATKTTYGTLIYQEQMLSIGRNYGQLSWEDTSTLRKAVSKSLGDEFFDQFKIKFVDGAKKHGQTEEQALAVWKAMHSFGSWCLSGETVLQNPYPNQLGKKFITLKELYENKGYIRKPPYYNMKKQKLFSMFGNKIKPIQLLDVYKSGEKETFLLELDNGLSIRSTLQHNFYTEKGWKKLADLKIGEKIAVMGKRRNGTKNKPFKGTGSGAHNEWHGECLKYNENLNILKNKTDKCSQCNSGKYEETHHIDCNKLNNELDNLLPVCRKCHKKIHKKLDGENICVPHRIGKNIDYVKIISISDQKIEMTYDISMPGPYHNFIANGIVCHNSFNKSHAVSYGLISYICAYLKAHYPLEFVVANLNHSKNEKSALKILRDAVENDGVEYKFFSPKYSKVNWSVTDGVLYGGFSSLKNIGEVKAKKAIACREANIRPPEGLMKAIRIADSPFRYLYPAKEVYGDYYTDPKSHGLSGVVTTIADAQCDGNFTIIGCLIKKNLRDANEACFVNKRNGKHLEGETAWLNITIEDDTGQMMCKIKIEDYVRFGKEITETGKDDHDWYIVYGEKINGWSILFVKNIMKITR